MNAVDATQFETYRPLMFSIAYRMRGSATDAEGIVQEAYLRYQATAPEQIVSPKAFLSTVVTRLCLNQLRSAKAQRESYLLLRVRAQIYCSEKERRQRWNCKSLTPKQIIVLS
jgi:DNA-directed RNA polymerase specialized sigma24 family protein